MTGLKPVICICLLICLVIVWLCHFQTLKSIKNNIYLFIYIKYNVCLPDGKCLYYNTLLSKWSTK